MLGGVDCSFVIWHHAGEHGLDVGDVLRDTVDAYGERIRQTLEMGFERVLVVSPPLPAVKTRPLPCALPKLPVG